MVSFGYWRDMDNADLDYKQVEVAVPFIKYADVSLRYGEVGDSDYTQLNISKELKNNFSVTLIDLKVLIICS